MKKNLVFGFLFIFVLALGPFFLWAETAPAAISKSAPVSTPKSAADSKPVSESRPVAVAPTGKLVADFEGEEGLRNKLGGESGSWNLNQDDENNSFTDSEVVEILDSDGKPTKALKLNYSVDSEVPSQNGFWTKLMNLDASNFDHLEFEVKGDPEKGFTNIFRLELKKFKNEKRDEKIKGSTEIHVTEKWRTVSIPLNKITGILDFSNPEVWKDPSTGRKNLDEFVVIFQDRHVSQKKGVIYLDNIRFVKSGNPGPTAVDSPPRKKEKTATKIEGLEFARFLIKRLGGFPKQVVVKKEFPKDDQEFLKEVARDTWRFFDEITDQENGLPLDTIQLGKNQPLEEGAWVGDYTNVTNIGVYLLCVVSAYDFGFITQDDAVRRLKVTLTTLEHLEYHKSGFPYNYYDTTTLERTSYFVSLVDSGWLVAGLFVVKNAFPEALKDQAERLIQRGNFSFFYDPVERQMFHGFYDHLKVYSDYHYGTFYTEPRLASYLAIARGDVPLDHWFQGLPRTFPDGYTWQEQMPQGRSEKYALGQKYEGGYYQWQDLKHVPSWGGSAFEALMSTIFLNEKKLAPDGLGLNDLRHAQGQMRYALDELKMPVWGMSPSSVPEGGYSEFGAKPFGSKGYKSGVVTPHASALSLEFLPKEATDNLRKLIELYPIYGEYGFYDSVRVVAPGTPKESDPDKDGKKITYQDGLVAYKYLALDQGMILAAINNYLNDGALRKRFHADPVIQQGEKLLSSEKLFDDSKTALTLESNSEG